MPVIPTYTSSEPLNTDAGGMPRVTVDNAQYSAQAAMGAAVGSLGHSISDLASTFQAREEKQQQFATRGAEDQFQNQLAQDEQDKLKDINEGGYGFTQDMRQLADKKYQDFIGTVPENLRPQYQQRYQSWIGTKQLGWAQTEAKMSATYAVKSINEWGDDAKQAIANDPSQLGAYKKEAEDRVNMALVPNSTKANLLDQVQSNFESIAIQTEAGADKAKMSQLLGMRYDIGPGSVAAQRAQRVLDPSTQSFLQQRSGGKDPSSLDGTFGNGLAGAIKEAEAATGTTAGFTSLTRDPKTQAQLHANYTGEPVTWEGVTYNPQAGVKQGPAAAPGKSLHQTGMAADLQDGAVLQWLHAHPEVTQKYGLEFLGGKTGQNDPGHIQLAAAMRNGGGDGVTGAASMIRGFENYTPVAKPDMTMRDGQSVNSGFRAGYGSGTITKPDGTTVDIQPGMTVTRADAERDLTRRITVAQKGIADTIGADKWAALTPGAQAALTSVAYNYGSLPDRVAAVAKLGDATQIATAVENLSGDNGGINKTRRMQEAEAIRSGIAPVGGAIFTGERDPRFEHISFEDGVKLIRAAGVKQDQNLKLAADQQNAQAMQVEANRKSFVDDLHVQIERGKPVTQSQIDDLYDRGIVKDSHEYDRLKAAVTAQGKNDEAINGIVAKLSSQDGTPQIYTKVGDGKGLEALVTKLGVNEKLAKMDQQAAERVQGLFSTTGMLPDTTRQTFEAMLRSGNVQQYTYALTTLDKMSKSNPSAFSSEIASVSPKLSGIVSDFQSSVLKDPVASFNRQKAFDDPANAKAIKMDEEAGKKLVKDLDPKDILSKLDERGILGRVTDAAPQLPGPQRMANGDMVNGANLLLSDYKEAFVERFSQNGGDEVGASKFALDKVKQEWAVSPSSGNKLVKYAPETLPDSLFPDKESGWLTQQVKNAMQEVLTGGRQIAIDQGPGAVSTVDGIAVPTSPQDAALAGVNYTLVPDPVGKTQAEIAILRDKGVLPDGRKSPGWWLTWQDPGTGAWQSKPFTFDVDSKLTEVAQQARDNAGRRDAILQGGVDATANVSAMQSPMQALAGGRDMQTRYDTADKLDQIQGADVRRTQRQARSAPGPVVATDPTELDQGKSIVNDVRSRLQNTGALGGTN